MRPSGEETQTPQLAKLAKQWAEPESVKRWAGHWGNRQTDEASGKASYKLAGQKGEPQSEKQRGRRRDSRQVQSATQRFVKRWANPQ